MDNGRKSAGGSAGRAERAHDGSSVGGRGRGRSGDAAAAVRVLGRPVRGRSRPSAGVWTASSRRSPTRSSTVARACSRLPSRARCGVGRGELVALISDNRPEWMVCSLAIHFLGAVDVPRASDTPPDILEAILRHAEPAVVILEDPAQLPRVCEALPGLRAAVVIDGVPPRFGRGSSAAGGACEAYTLAELMALGEAAWPESPGRSSGAAKTCRPRTWRRSSTRRARPALPRAWRSPTPTTSSTCASSPSCSASSVSRSSRCCSRGTPTSGRCSSCTSARDVACTTAAS